MTGPSNVALRPHAANGAAANGESPAGGFGTLAVHAGSPHDPVTGAVIESVSRPLAFQRTVELLIRRK